MTTTTTIEARTAEIATALKDLTSKSPITTYDLPEVLHNSAIAGTETVRNALSVAGRRLTLEKIARFFSTVYTAEDVHTFLAAYDAAAPECYDQDKDLEAGTPWCCPWLTGAMGAEKGDTPETLGRKAACMDYQELETLFGPDEEGLAAKTEAAVRGFLLRGAPIPEFLKPEEGILSKAAAEIAAVEGRTDDDEEADRLESEIVSQCIAEVTPLVAMRRAR